MLKAIRDLIFEKQFQRAKELLIEHLEKVPEDGQALLLLADTHAHLHEVKRAEKTYLRLLEKEKDHLKILLRLGRLYLREDCFQEAKNCFQRAQDKHPLDAQVQLAKVDLLAKLGKWEEALFLCQQQRDSSLKKEFFRKGGSILSKLNRHQESLSYFSKSLTLYSLEELKSPDDALLSYLEALYLTHDANRWKKEFSLCSKKVQITQDFYRGVFLFFLARGHMQEGFHIYLRRIHDALREKMQINYKKPFDLSSLQGKEVSFLWEQGLGDQLFFLRYAQQLSKQGIQVSCFLKKRLAAFLKKHLASSSLAIHCSSEKKHVHPAYPLGDLPYLLGVQDETCPPSSLYLKPLPEEINYAKNVLRNFGPPPYLGITWRAGTYHGNRKEWSKEVPLKKMAHLICDLPHSVVVLQRDPFEGEVAFLEKVSGLSLLDLSSWNQHLDRILALLFLLDEYVGVSNTNMHLRGALKKANRVMAIKNYEWMWRSQEGRSVFYPESYVYFASIDGAWTNAFKRIHKDLLT